MNIGIVDILGADRNIEPVLNDYFHNSVGWIDEGRSSFSGFDLVVVPSSPLLGHSRDLQKRVASSGLYDRLASFSSHGGFIVGIQSGFEILCDAGLLEGRFPRSSRQLPFNGVVHVKADFKKLPLTYFIDTDRPLRLYLSTFYSPLALGAISLASLQQNGQILMRFCNEHGDVSASSDPLRIVGSVAAMCNASRNVFGIIPDPIVNKHSHHSLDGFDLIESFFKMITR